MTDKKSKSKSATKPSQTKKQTNKVLSDEQLLRLIKSDSHLYKRAISLSGIEASKKTKQLKKDHDAILKAGAVKRKAKKTVEGQQLQKKLKKFAKHEDSVINPVTNRPIKLAGKSFVTHGKKGNVKFTEYKSPAGGFNLVKEHRDLLKWFKTSKHALPKNKDILSLLDRKIQIEDKDNGTNKFTVVGTISFLNKHGVLDHTPIRVDDDKMKRNIITLPKGIDRDTATLYIASKVDKYTKLYGNVQKLDALVLDPVNTKLAQQKMKGVRFQSKLLTDVSAGVSQRDGFCTVDYLWHEMEGKPRFAKSMTFKKLVSELSEFCDVNDGVSTTDIINWKLKYHRNISVYALNAMKEVFISSPAGLHEKHTLILTFMVSNEHLYPITKESCKQFIAKGKRLQEFDVKMEEFRFDIKFSGEQFNILNDDNMDEFIRGETDGKIWILDDENKSKLNPKDDKKSMVSLANDCMVHTDFLIEHFDMCSASKINAFVHPTSGQVVVLGTEFERRRELCKTLFDIYQVDCFRFINQSMCQISRDLFKIVTGHTRTSTYTELVGKILDDFKPNALIQTIEEGDISEMKIEGLDTKKAYSWALLSNTFDIPIFSINSTIEDYTGDKIVCGLYYIEGTQLIRYSNGSHALALKPAFYSWNLVQYLLDNGHIQKSAIKYCIKASFSLKADMFKSFVEFCYKHLKIQDGKDIVNLLVGWYGKSVNKTYHGCVTDSAETLCCLMSDILDAGDQPIINMFEHLFVVRKEIRTKLGKDNVSIWNHVISAGIANLLGLCERVKTNNGTIIGVNTDCVFYTGCEQISDVLKMKEKMKDEDEEEEDHVKNIGKASPEISPQPKLFHEYEACDELDITKYTVSQGNGVIYTGLAGSGKTQKLLDIIATLNDGEYMVLSPTNKACVNINIRNGKAICSTPNSLLFLAKSDSEKIRMLNKTVLIDEFAMVNDYWMSLFYRAWLVNKNKFIMFGDPNQLQAVEEEIEPINHLNSVGVKQMCPTVIELQYLEVSGRYDIALKMALDTFLDTGSTCDFVFKKIDISLKVNIVSTNEKRREITKRLCKTGDKVKFYYQKNYETYKVDETTPILCTVNNKKLNLISNMVYKINHIDNHFVCISGKMVKEFKMRRDMFAKSFIPSYAFTVHKSQGDTIREPYNIWEAKTMSKSQFYTAVSRSSHSNLIHCSAYNDIYKVEKSGLMTCKKLDAFSNEYKNGKIYRIDFSNGSLYIGETILTVEERLKQHLNDVHGTVYKYIEANPGITCTITQIATTPCDDHGELMRYETYYIQLHQKEHGIRLINKKQLHRVEKIKEDEVDISIKTSISDSRFNIKHNEDKRELAIQYRDENGSKKCIKKRYKVGGFEDAMTYMKNKREGILIDLASL